VVSMAFSLPPGLQAPCQTPVSGAQRDAARYRRQPRQFLPGRFCRVAGSRPGLETEC